MSRPKRRLRIEYGPNDLWATISTRGGSYVCTVNARVGKTYLTKQQSAAFRRRARLVRDALEKGFGETP